MATNTTHATSQASVSESNRSRIVKHLYHNGISSRAQIAKALELTPAAITKITARLIEAGMIEETGDLEGSKNRLIHQTLRIAHIYKSSRYNIRTCKQLS